MSDTQKSARKLGRGLSSLLGGDVIPVHREVVPAKDTGNNPEGGAADGTVRVPESGPGHAVVIDLPLQQIRPNPYQPRREFDPESLKNLAESLVQNGLIQPVVVRHVPGGYELIAGERRLRAAQIAGLSTIPAIIRPADAALQAQLALVENIQREDLNPIDRAEAYASLIQSLGITQAELASRLGEQRSGIANHLRLLELTEGVRELVRARQLSVGHAKLLAGVQDPSEQLRLARLVVDQGLSVRNLERILSNLDQPTIRPPQAPASPHVRDLERSISTQLGLRVQLRTRGKKRGRLVLHYASLEQFDDLMSRMGVKLD